MIASVTLTLGAAAGAAIGSLVGRVARWFVRKTKTPRDDAALDAIEAFLRRNPELVAVIAEAVRAAILESESHSGDS